MSHNVPDSVLRSYFKHNMKQKPETTVEDQRGPEDRREKAGVSCGTLILQILRQKYTDV